MKVRMPEEACRCQQACLSWHKKIAVATLALWKTEPGAWLWRLQHQCVRQEYGEGMSDFAHQERPAVVMQMPLMVLTCAEPSQYDACRGVRLRLADAQQEGA